MAELKVGTVVYSAAGHDKGNMFVTVGLEGDFAFIADGNERKLEKPKRKRIKHLKITNTSLDMTKTLTDKELRRIFSANKPQAR
ncbi:MAG: KOW domain-containing RNA-binding protein [Ruminococcus sp.]|jgi:ribosomal protein L14E/L6E/L27E|nr:KOW domain-containing RNA-binding protein [Ruminococcus sp.]